MHYTLDCELGPPFGSPLNNENIKKLEFNNEIHIPTKMVLKIVHTPYRLRGP